MSLKEFLATTRGTQKTVQNVRWLCQPINFWSPTEQLVKDYWPLLNHSLIIQANFTETTMKFFTMPNLKFYRFAKNFLRKSSQLVHMAIKELLRLSYGLVNQSYCQFGILRVQLKFNWTVDQCIITSDSKTVWKNRLVSWKLLLILFSGRFGY